MKQILYILIKRIILTNILFFITANIPAQDPYALLDSANSCYSDSRYDDAIKNYKKILSLGYESAELYYNLGNAYFKTNQLSNAILNYERAKLHSPQDEYINTNLEIARTYVEDKIEVIPEFFITKWINTIKYAFTSDNWAIFSIIGFVLFLTLFLFYLFSTKLFIKKSSFWISLILFFISIFCFWFSYKQKDTFTKHDKAIIFDQTVTVKSSPDESGTDLFLLHEGTKVQLLDSIGNWREIKISDGNVGWLENKTIRKI